MSAVPAADRLVTASDNMPPPKTAIEIAAEAVADLAKWASENPTVSNQDQAKAAETMVKRCTATLAELEVERKAKVQLLNEAKDAIQAEYNGAKAKINVVISNIDTPHRNWLRAEELRLEKITEAAKAARDEAERIAREADAKARAALEDASVGVVDTGHVEAEIIAEETFTTFQRADRFAARAERDSKVKGLRTVEVLSVADIAAAATAMSDDVDLIGAIKTAARRYRKTWKHLPPGVTSRDERV